MDMGYTHGFCDGFLALSIPPGMSIKGNLLKVCVMVMEHSSMQVAPFTLDLGRITKNTVG